MVPVITLACMISAFLQAEVQRVYRYSNNKYFIILDYHYVLTEPPPLDKLPPHFLRDVEAAGDRLVAKATQLIQNKTTNITENFMSIRCKMDGGKFYNRIQSGSFQHRSMAAALRVQNGPSWTTSILNRMGLQSSICDKFTIGRKQKHDKNTARKVLLKYKKQRLMTRYGQSTVNSSPDTSYGSDPAEPNISADELKRLCQEYLIRLQVGDTHVCLLLL